MILAYQFVLAWLESKGCPTKHEPPCFLSILSTFWQHLLQSKDFSRCTVCVDLENVQDWIQMWKEPTSWFVDGRFLSNLELDLNCHEVFKNFKIIFAERMDVNELAREDSTPTKYSSVFTTFYYLAICLFFPIWMSSWLISGSERFSYAFPSV